MTIKATTRDAAPATQELNEFLLELGLALQRYALYPGGHPSIDSAVGALVGGLDDLLADREVLSLGVARRQLIVDGVATEETHPVLRTVAERLHRHRVGVVSFRRGLAREELAGALRAVSQDPERSGVTLGLLTRGEETQWPHVRFHSLAYDQLQLADQEEDADAQSDGGGGGLAAQLWLGLARAALAQEDSVDADHPSQVAEAINANVGARAYDQVIVGYMLQLTDELKRDPGAALDPVRARLSQVVKRLDPATLDRLLEMGGDGPQRARFLHGAASGLQPDAVLDLVSAAARAEGQDISTSLLRLLRKLSSAAQVSGGSADADVQLREQVRSLLVGWSLADPNPDAYTAVLESMARASPESSSERAHHPAGDMRLVQMSLEVGAIGAAVLRAVDNLLAANRLGELAAVLAGAPPGSAAVPALWTRIERSDVVRLALTKDPVDLEPILPLLNRLPASSVISLVLDRISESESRQTRQALLRHAAALGLPLVPAVAERLDDPRWFVQRNMLMLLNGLNAWPRGRSAMQYVRHADARVRREALQAAVRIPAERDEAILAALSDADERNVRLGIGAAREHGLPPSAVTTALNRSDDTALDSDIRVILIRLVAPHAATAVDRLLPLVLLPRTLLRGARLAPVSARMLAALTCLAAARVDDPRVAQATALARASRDPRVQRAISRST